MQATVTNESNDQLSLFCEWFGLQEIVNECFSRDKMEILVGLANMLAGSDDSLDLVKRYYRNKSGLVPLTFLIRVFEKHSTTNDFVFEDDLHENLFIS